MEKLQPNYTFSSCISGNINCLSELRILFKRTSNVIQNSQLNFKKHGFRNILSEIQLTILNYDLYYLKYS